MQPNLNEKLCQLEQRYLQDLPDKLASIDNLWRKLTLSKWNDDAFGLFYKLVHGISGTAGSFGLDELGEVARSIDMLCSGILRTGRPPDSEQRNVIGVCLEGLNRQLGLLTQQKAIARTASKEIATLPQRAVQHRTETLVYVLEDDDVDRELMQAMLANKGVKVQTFSELAAMESALVTTLPDVIVMDIMLSEGSSAGLEHAVKLKQGVARDIPVLFTSARVDLMARLEAVRAGGEGYFPKPVNIDQLAARIHELTDDQSQIGYRIMLVDDDKDLLSYVTAILNEEAMNVVAVSNPLQVMEQLNGRHFDLFILDMHMPGASGIELAKIIRQCGEHSGTPIIFLSAEMDPEIQAGAMMTGADEFVEKPVKPERLLRIVRNRISRMRKLSARVRYLTEKEPVTGLFNRQYFYSQLEKVIQRSKTDASTFAMLDVDLDNFILLRDQVGADSWDIVIAGLGQAIHEQFDQDVIVAHVSEHMICILFECEHEEAALLKAEQVRTAVQQARIEVIGRQVRTTCSLGVVMVDKHAISVAEVMYEAELACDAVRQGQGNGVQLHHDAEAQGSDSKVEDADSGYERLIRKALTTSDDGKGFYTVYQPIVSLSSAREEKYDVLLRLRDGSGKEVLPSRFMPVAEKSELLANIDYWVVEHAISVLSKRLKEGNNSTFFIKVMLETVNDKEFLGWLRNRIIQSGVPGKQLVFQVAESIVAKNFRQVATFANEVKKCGCAFAMEHFGTQLNSEQLLSQLPVDYIKIDGAYMTDLGRNKENKETVSRIARQALNNNVFAIASFVEDADSLAVLWACGVNYMQGYFLQEPAAEMAYDFSVNM